MRMLFPKFLRNKFVIAGLIVVALIASTITYKKFTAPPNFDAVEVRTGDITQSVGVMGTISPAAKADLAFQKGGVISRVYVKVGDKVNKGQIIAAIAGGSERAALDSAKATLADMSRVLSPQELEVQKTALASAQTSFDAAGKDAPNAAHEGYVKAQGALVNYTDTFFSNPQTVYPRIILRTESELQEDNINIKRVVVSGALAKWSSLISATSTSDEAELLLKSKEHLAVIKLFMGDLSSIVGVLSTSNSGLSSSAINAHAITMNSGLSALDSAINTVATAQSALSTAKSSLKQAQSSYDLKLAGNSTESIAAQAAKVAQAQASVSEGVIISPISGIVTKADPNEGEFVSTGQAGFAVQNSNFKIEAFVPEADIAKLTVGNVASSTLDAYGADADFPAEVIMINPAETVLEGVPTYKVTLQFTNPDPRIRSGMTANLTIFTNKIARTLMIPYRAIIDKDGSKSVRLVNPDGKSFKEVPVMIGLKGSDGNIQVISGLEVGDLVVIYIKQ